MDSWFSEQAARLQAEADSPFLTRDEDANVGKDSKKKAFTGLV
jgi:hypothetical protein